MGRVTPALFKEEMKIVPIVLMNQNKEAVGVGFAMVWSFGGMNLIVPFMKSEEG